MARLIPRKTKVKTEFIKGMSLIDAGIILFFMVLLFANSVNIFY